MQEAIWVTKMSETIAALHSLLEEPNKDISDMEGAVKCGHVAGDTAKQKPVFYSFPLF